MPVAWKPRPEGAGPRLCCGGCPGLRPRHPHGRGPLSCGPLAACLAAGWCGGASRRGGPPGGRLNASGTGRPTGSGHFAPLATVAPHVGSGWRGTGSTVQRAPHQLPGTWLAGWEAGYAVPWVSLTDVPPEARHDGGSGRRAWREQGGTVTGNVGRKRKREKKGWTCRQPSVGHAASNARCACAWSGPFAGAGP